MNVAICDYGAGNTRSVEIAFARLGATLADDVEAADLAVLPGVGSARSAMEGLRGRGLDDVLRERVEDGRRVLGICLGLQLALERSRRTVASKASASPGPGGAMSEGRIPRIGWARSSLGTRITSRTRTPPRRRVRQRVRRHRRVAERGAFTGVQFHPEKSGAAGARFLESLCLSLV